MVRTHVIYARRLCKILQLFHVKFSLLMFCSLATIISFQIKLLLSDGEPLTASDLKFSPCGRRPGFLCV